MTLSNKKCKKVAKTDPLLLLKWMHRRVVPIRSFLLSSSKRNLSKAKKDKNFLSFILSTWLEVKRLVRLVPRVIVLKKLLVSTKVCPFWVSLFRPSLIKPRVKAKISLFLTEIPALPEFCRMPSVVIPKLWWSALFLLPMTTMKKPSRLWDTLTKPKKYKTRPSSTKVKLTNLSELWKLKNKSFLKKLKKWKKCSRSLTWASLIPACLPMSWKNSTRPENNCDTTQRLWMIWQWPKKKNLNTKSKNSILRSSLTNQNLTYQTWTKILNWVEKSITKSIRKEPRLVKEVFSLRMTFKLEEWESGRTMPKLQKRKITFMLRLWMRAKTVMCI